MAEFKPRGSAKDFWNTVKGISVNEIIREAARPVLIDAVYRRQKHPFMSPPATVQPEGRLYGFIQDTLRGAALDGPGIYDRRKVTTFLDDLPGLDDGSRVRADTVLMWMTSVCLLSRRMSVS